MLARGGNIAVTQLDGRAFPGLHIQGDTFANLRQQVVESARRLRRDPGDSEALDDLDYVGDELTQFIQFYESVLAERDIERPYVREDAGSGSRRADAPEDTGLDNAEYLVLGDLESSPRPLWELGWNQAPSRQAVTEILGPGLVSLAARGLIEVRHFDRWPAPWEEGAPVTADDLRQLSSRVEVWSGESPHGTLAAQLTEAGVPYL